MKIRSTFILALFLIASLQLKAQQDPRQSIHLGLAANSFHGNTFEGDGTLLNLGIQKQLKNPRVHFNPDITLSFNNNRKVIGEPRASFTGLSVRSLFQYDLLQGKTVTLFIGGGGIMNYTSGNRADGIMDNSPLVSHSLLHVGLAGNLGIRISPNNSAFGFEILPLNAQTGNDGYGEVFAMARIFLSLDGRRSKAATTR